MKEKALVYITCKKHILIIRHVEHPEVGLQVPAGTIEAGESPEFAAIREAEEETGIKGFRLVRKLGVWKFDMRPFVQEVHRRHYFHLEIEGEDVSRRWLHIERHPAQGKPENTISFELFWKALGGNDLGLVAGHGDFLPSLNHKDHQIHVRHHTKNLEFEIKTHRLNRISKINAELSKLSSQWTESTSWVTKGALGFAMFEHFYNQILHAVRRNKTQEVTLLFKHWANPKLQLLLNRKPFLVVFAENCTKVLDPRFNSPLYLVPISQIKKVHENELFNNILAVTGHLRDRGYGDILDPWIGTIILKRQRKHASESDSFTLSALCGSICFDIPEHNARMAEFILHKASQVWLNEALFALGESLPRDLKYVSPWKNTERSAYGMLHAAWAFSQMIQWFQYGCSNPGFGEIEQVYCLERLKVEIPKMRSALPEISEVCNFLKDPRLRGLILDEVNRSIQTTGPENV